MGANTHKSPPTTLAASAKSGGPSDQDPLPGAVAVEAGQEHTNIALVCGQLVSGPETRTLASGSVAVSFSLTVRSAGEKTTSVPAVWYDPPKRVTRWAAGDGVVVCGAIVRRFFRGAGGLGSATEVVVQRGELIKHQRKAAAVRDRLLGLLTP